MENTNRVTPKDEVTKLDIQVLNQEEVAKFIEKLNKILSKKVSVKTEILDCAEVTVKDKDGNIKSHHTIIDLLTNAGLAQMSALCGNIGSPVAINFLGIGTGTTAAAVTDTVLQTPVKIKVATTISQITTSVTNDTLKLSVVFSNAIDSLTGTSAITEVGAMTAATSYVLLMHQVYTPADNMNWDNGDTYTLTITIQMKQGT